MAAAASVSGACSRAIAPVSVRVTSRARAAAEPRRARAAMRSIRAQKLNDGVVPVAVNTTHGPMGLTSALLLDRIIIIGDRIDEDVATRVCAELLALSYEDPDKDIRLFVNATAGTQYCVQTILDMMEYIQSKGVDISVVGMGCVAGPPAMLLAAGTKGKRLAMPSCRIILSQLSEASAGRPTRLGSRRRSCRETRECRSPSLPSSPESRSTTWASTWCAIRTCHRRRRRTEPDRRRHRRERGQEGTMRVEDGRDWRRLFNDNHNLFFLVLAFACVGAVRITSKALEDFSAQTSGAATR